MTNLSIDAKTFRRVTGHWLTAHEIWLLVGEGRPENVARALVRLWEAGRIERTKEKPPRYRRRIMVG